MAKINLLPWREEKRKDLTHIVITPQGHYFELLPVQDYYHSVESYVKP